MPIRLLALLFALVLPGLAGAQALFQEGTHYQRIDPPQPTQVAQGKVEVVEVFAYTCIHCAHFEPFLASWKARKPEHVEFRGVPAVFSPAMEPHARAFFAAEALNALDALHEPMFKAIHQERRALATLEQIADFAAQQGIDRAAFMEAAGASSTDLKLRRAREQAMRWRVPGTPSVIVNGKYLVQAGQGGFQGMLEVVDFLVAQEMRGN
ncbi:MAG: thiol:disulfide interchange protein DsbA/DsbL [Xanthomonadales bacterium]|nr:thiol:disulfide interchange protein DsbA/DsbL [Xanthomonadales bacterium]